MVSVTNLLAALNNYETFYGKEKKCTACAQWLKTCNGECKCKKLTCMKHAQAFQPLLEVLHKEKVLSLSSRDESFFAFFYSLSMRYAHPVTIYINVRTGLLLMVKKNECFLQSQRIANVLIIWFTTAGRSQQLKNSSNYQQLDVFTILESTKMQRLILVNSKNYLRHMPQDTKRLQQLLHHT